MASNSNLIDIRMKLSGGRAVVSGLTGTRKETEKLGSATTKTSHAAGLARGTTSRLTGAYRKLGANAKLAFGLVGAGAIFAVHNAITNTEELGKVTAGLTRNLGLQTNVASRWGAVAHSREIDSKSLTMSFSALSKQMVEAGRKGGTLLTPFHQLGITQDEVKKGADNFQWGLMRVAEAMGDEEGGSKRLTAAKALLGRGYTTILPLFSEGTKGLKEQLKWADEYGVTLSGKTNDGIMDMVMAQRENKVAMLGLQVTLTQALMPAIKRGDEELQDFIKTLNDPNLTAEQKVKRISKQFLGIEKDIIDVINKALPTVAEHAGQLGVAIAGALVNGFVNSDTIGRVAIAGYVFSLFGGRTLAMAGAKKVGGLIGTSVGIGLATGVVGAFLAYEIWSHMSSKMKVELLVGAEKAAAWFVDPFIEQINKGMDEANIFSFLGVDAPNIGLVTPNDVDPNAFGPPIGTGTGPGVGAGIGGKKKPARQVYEEVWGVPPPAGPPPWPHPKKSQTRPRPQAMGGGKFNGLAGTSSSGGGTTHIHLHVGNKEIGQAVLKAGQDAAALK